MSDVAWYFDFVSPYSYFALPAINRLSQTTKITFEPLLFAGLLNFWGQKGPAEIPPKRTWTYRACVWWAQQHHVPFRMPAAHPFNSLPFLRLAIAAGNSASAIEMIFRQLWTTGVNPADPVVVADLAKALNVPLQRLSAAEVKQSLRDATDRAAARQVFGVPTIRVGDELFWGSDAVDFAAAYLANPGVLATEQMRRADATPIGASRV
jgi:2-hydroxychromene-2-carboxylate isomerase